MNERIRELNKAAQEYAGRIVGNDEDSNYNEWFNVYKAKFAELIVAEAFRAGMLYSAKKYTVVGDEQFTGNDVAMFLEMEACELSDEDIKEHFGVE